VLTDAAIDDLRRIGPIVAPRVVEWCASLVDEPLAGDPLASTQFRSLRVAGDAGRIVYDAADGVATVRLIWIDGRRSDGEAYGEALRQMQAADPPDLVALARILQRLGRLTGTRPVARSREPVPDWLADVLVQRGAQDRVAVAALDAATAFDLWNQLLTPNATNRQ
jgi:mRNA interferase RelE/StbE